MLYRFYYIRCDETNDIYIGKTKQKLPRRLGGHIKKKDCTSKIITQYKSCVIILLEEVECTKIESVAIERAYIETYVCVNKTIPGRTLKEYYQYKKIEIIEKHKINRKKNPIKFAALKRKYNQKNAVKIAEKTKIYHQKNAVKIAETQKIYHQKNAVELSKKRKEKYTCECGKICGHSSKARHERSQFHKNFCVNK